eukprot:TRINITY_DN18274_c0_g1_i1.p1 TRINITY_DN18274_c0_g1~~TRINITY_DN18274_c0_g1_i1.p1  ORF type:complete len:309 (+),score=48.29 TRINITY_DN18274_c0_g1_i1:104-1030(+)
MLSKEAKPAEHPEVPSHPLGEPQLTHKIWPRQRPEAQTQAPAIQRAAWVQPAEPLHRHHGPFFPGEHVVVKKFGEAMVAECKHNNDFSGRVEVRYPDGSVYHCYPSKLRMLPLKAAAPCYKAPPQAPARGPPPPVRPFYLGERVVVDGYGVATVMEIPSHGKHKNTVKVRYADGSTYHCKQEQLASWHAPHASRLTPVTLQRSSQVQVGDLVHVHGYGTATVIGLPEEGRYAGRVKVRYPDRSTYHCYRHELAPKILASVAQAMPVTAAPAQKATAAASQCLCGLSFPSGDDSKFCRMCGRRREIGQQ